MNIKYEKFFLGLAMITLSGCAKIPEATLTYFLPKAEVKVTIKQDVDCTDESNPLVTTELEFNNVYSADPSKRKTLDISNIDTFYSHGDIDISFTKDGRLTGLNSTVTGDGSEIIKVVSTIADVAGIPGLDIFPLADDATLWRRAIRDESISGPIRPIEETNPIEEACKEINRVAGKQPLSLTSEAVIPFTKEVVVGDLPVVLTKYSKSFYDSIKYILGDFKFSVSKTESGAPVLTNSSSNESVVLVRPAMTSIEVIRIIGGETGTSFSAEVPVPQWGEEYSVPIPTPPLFGKNNISLKLYDSGTINQLKYGSVDDVKELSSALSTLHEKLDLTAEEKAKLLKAEADLIVQQQRLAKCRANPEACTP